MSTEIVTTEQPNTIPRPRITLVCVGKTYIQNGKMYIVEDEKTYPRAVDADGIAHHNAASYD